MKTFIITDDVAERILLRHDELNDAWVLVSESKVSAILTEQELREKIEQAIYFEITPISGVEGVKLVEAIKRMSNRILTLIKENHRNATVLNPEEAHKIAEIILKEAVK